MAIIRTPTPLVSSLTGRHDPAINECCALCASITGSELVVVSVLHDSKQWVIGGVGVEPGLVGASEPLCEQVVRSGELIDIPDLTTETRFDCESLRQAVPSMRRYAGTGLEVRSGRIGTLCLFGREPGRLTDGQRDHLLQTARIISALLEQRHDSIELGQTQARLRDVALCTADCFWECTPDLITTWHSANANSPGLTGWRPLVGKPLPEAVVCDALGDPDPCSTGLFKLLQRHPVLKPVLIKLETPAGPNWLSIASRHVLDEHGRCVAIRGSVHEMRDVVRIRRAESDRQVLLAQVARYVPGFFFQLEARSVDDLQVVFASEGLSALCGLDSEGVRADFDSFLSRIHPDDFKAVVQSMQESAAALTPWQRKFRLVVPGSEERRLVGYATPVRHHGDAIHWHGFVADDSDVERLERQKLAAEQASEAKSKFLSRVNHELRTPLNGVLGFAQLMASDTDNPLAPIQLKRLGHIESAGLRLLDLINSMLNLTRLEHQNYKIQHQQINLPEMVSECVALAEPLAHDKAITLRISAPQLKTRVLADTHALAQVIGNLISNAVHYSGEGSVVFIAVQEIGERYCVSVIDQGPGLTDDELRMLFQPFNRLGAENTPIRGFGLGLSVSQALAQAMGGRITVKSTPGRGSSFRLHLQKAPIPAQTGISQPDIAPKAADINIDHSVREPARTIADTTGPLRVMYAEDDRLNAVLVKDALERREGFNVEHVEDGEAAWQALQQQRPHILLADINMPNVNGYELIARVRSDPALADLPCVAISADAMPEQVQSGLAAGFDAYWPKPINLLQLTERIEKLLQRTHRVERLLTG